MKYKWVILTWLTQNKCKFGNSTIATSTKATSIRFVGPTTPILKVPLFLSSVYFFIATFVLSISLIIMLMRYVFITSPHFYIGLFLCSYFLYRFLSLAFSDPGLARNRDNGGEQQNVNFCQTCVLPMRRRTFHCQICDVCVDGYDHHCIFVGKCIGRGNMGQFK